MSIKANFSIPVHPGEVLQEMISGVGMSQAAFARCLHIPPTKLNEIIRGRRGITAESAIRLAKAFSAYDSTPGFWLNLQKNWELSQADAGIADNVEPIRRRA